jgi:hypothetical protein
MRPLLILLPSLIFGQGFSVISELDTTQGFIGDVIQWTVKIDGHTNEGIRFPELNEINDTLTIRNQVLIDEDGLLNGILFEIMAWDTGQFVTPDYSIDILNPDGTLDFSLETEPISFSISSILAATDQTDFRPIKGPVPVKGVISTRAILLSLILVGIVAGIIWTWRKRQKVQYQKLDYAVMEAPEDRALRRLKELDVSGLSKKYYADLSHISREYIETKYFIRALEMTTEEIHGFRSLFPMDESQFSQWIQFLNEADMVKYAREIPSLEKMSVDKEKISSLIHQL